MDKVVHFEIPADDMTRCQKFYEQAFGWKVNLVPGLGYALVNTVEVDEKFMPKERGAINGGIMKKDKIKNPVITIHVGEMGYSAYFSDTEKNVIGLWQNMRQM